LRVTEEELMALYAIARDELDGVKSACERLEKSVRRLENTGNNIDANAENGIRSVLKGFNEEVRGELRKHVFEASVGLTRSIEEAKQELRCMYWYKQVNIFMFGVVVGAVVLGCFMWRNLKDVRTGQSVLYEELQILKSRSKVQKPKVKHKKVEPTQSGEAPEEG
jgi:hypothetical protein